MNKNRLEAFSDGVIAIIITIMVLELKTPVSAEWPDLLAILPMLGSYVLSFVFVGIYWNNHHHMMHTVTRVNGKILWANLHLLFWLSLVPFSMEWMMRANFMSLPVAAYGFVLLMAAVAYAMMDTVIIADQGARSKLKKAIGAGIKEKASMAIYVASIPLAFVSPIIALMLFVLVAFLWIVPDQRIESRFKE